MTTGVGHGKLLLCGEHAVVYGYPAVALAVDRCTTVTLERTDGPTLIRSSHADPRLAQALAAVLPVAGLAVEVQTNLPVGRGMGSSAALAVAVVRALASLRAEDPSPDEVYDRAMPIERAFHGNPSGVDVAVSARGGCLWFRKGDPPVREAIAPGPWRLVVLDTGEAGDTGALVAGVGARRPGIDPVLRRIGDLVHQARDVLDDAQALGALLTENHALLRQIGVSTPTLDALVELALAAGAHGAKLSGAGGGGVVLALVDDAEPVLEAARQQGVAAFGCAPWTP